jgi:hypothetical protein
MERNLERHCFQPGRAAHRLGRRTFFLLLTMACGTAMATATDTLGKGKYRMDLPNCRVFQPCRALENYVKTVALDCVKRCSEARLF